MFRRPSRSARAAARARPGGHGDEDGSGSGRLELGQLRRLTSFVGPYTGALVTGIVATGIASLFFLAFPLIVARLFNVAFEGGFNAAMGGSAIEGAAPATRSQLNVLGGVLLGIFVGQALFNYVRVYFLGLVGEGVVADLRKALYAHLLGLSIRFFESRKVGEITSRLTSDVSTLQAVVSQALAQFVNQGLVLVGGVAILFVLDWRLALVMLAVVPAVVLSGAFFGRRLRDISRDFQDALADANADADEAIANIRVVKTFTAEDVERARYGERIDRSYQTALRRARVRAMFVPSIIMASFIGIGLVLWYGSQLVLGGTLPPGDLLAFLFFTVSVAGAIGTFTGLYSQVQEAIGATRRIFDLLDTASDMPEPAAPVALEQARGAVRFENVDFRYGDRGDELVLRGIDLAADPGQVIALVGPSGAGKSTLVTLIPRFYDPTAGRITLDGHDLRDLELRTLRHHIGIVPQETQLFSGTIRENLRYGRPEAGDAEVEAAARAANAHDFIASFPDGYGTVVGERGVKLSGGQRQRVAIARALLKDPRILILDEATSSLDSESEALVQAALDRLMEGRTTFVIAHRLSTVLGADRILVLDEGRIVERGSHEALLAQGGLYADLYTVQFRSVEGVKAPRVGSTVS